MGRLDYLKYRPLPDPRELPEGYQRELAIALQRWNDEYLRAAKELDTRPMVRAELIAPQPIAGGNVETVIQFTNKNFDTHDWYDETLYRYAPMTSGVYLVTATVSFFYGGGGTPDGYIHVRLRKNGVSLVSNYQHHMTGDNPYQQVPVSDLIYLAGGNASSPPEYIDFVALTLQNDYSLDHTESRTHFTAVYLGGEIAMP